MSATEAWVAQAERTLRPTVHEALAAVARDVGAVAKNLKNIDSGYAARSIDDVLNAIHGPLTEHGVTIAPTVLKARYEVVHVGRNQTPMRQATLKVRYRFHGPAGDYVDTVTCGEALDSGDKATSKAMSAALKVALLQTFTIPIVGEDADSRTYERSAPPAVVVDGAKIDKVQTRVAALPEDVKNTFAGWKNAHAFPWPWPAAACDAMLAKLDELAPSTPGGEPGAARVAGDDDLPQDAAAPAEAATLIAASPPALPLDDDRVTDSYDSQATEQIRYTLERAGLDTTGTRKQLIARLREYDARPM